MQPQATISSLAQDYVNGTKSFREIKEAGVTSYIALLAALAELHLRPPVAREIGPNIETRRAGMARLASLLRKS